MRKLAGVVFFLLLFCGVLIQGSYAYDIPQRQVTVKPYVNFFFPNNLWETESFAPAVENKMGFGAGVKVRNQFTSSFGSVLNASYSSIEVTREASGDVTMFTAGGYYSRALGAGTFIFDFSYGIIIAADESVGLLMPSLEYSRPISDRMSVALELGWPIANDWPRDFSFKENYSSFTLSLGSVFVF